MRHIAMAACLLALCACASEHDSIEEKTVRSGNVDGRLLQPNTQGNGAAQVRTYQLHSQERFRMPQPQVAPTPGLPADSPRTSLAPTTVCARAIINAEGVVQRVDALDDRGECHAGATVENADLLQAVRDALLQWRYQPAAVCTYAADATKPDDENDCAGAEKIEAVPVSLMYAFTFELREGKVVVHSRGK